MKNKIFKKIDKLKDKISTIEMDYENLTNQREILEEEVLEEVEIFEYKREDLDEAIENCIFKYIEYINEGEESKNLVFNNSY